MSARLFELQGHRGARGLKPENTLPGFETAFDLGVTTIETDVHLTRDGVPVLIHDPAVSERLCRQLPALDGSNPQRCVLVSTLTLDQLSRLAADRNPDPKRFPEQDPSITSLAGWFCGHHGMHPYAPPSLAALFAFSSAYTGEPGRAVGKTDVQRSRMSEIRFDLELKRVPFRPQLIGDRFGGAGPGLLEQQVVDVVRAAELLHRTTVRSFDHRSLAAMRVVEPVLRRAVLVAGTAPIAPAQLAQNVGAAIYCPEYEFLDQHQVRQLHASSISVIPWTVNDADDLLRLLDWEVDGVTTDFPDRFGQLLRDRGIGFLPGA
jgi:glycerophosphoryl diester phosphodiesterase